MVVINDFKIKYQPDSFYEKLYLSFFLEEEKYYLQADFHIRTEKEYEDFFHSYEIKNQEDQVIYWQNFSPKVLKEVYEYIRNKIDQENDFIDYHYTGEIKESAYKNMNIDYSIDQYPRVIKVFQDSNGEEFEFRQSQELLKYVKKDESGEILRDDEGLALYLSKKEMEDKGLPLFDTAIIVFNKKEESVAVASDEWGADGIWVLENYQKRGIGTELLHEFRKQFDSNRKIGQMTPAGIRAVKSYFRKYIQK